MEQAATSVSGESRPARVTDPREQLLILLDVLSDLTREGKVVYFALDSASARGTVWRYTLRLEVR